MRAVFHNIWLIGQTALCLNGFAQGEVAFNNRTDMGDAPVFMPDCVTLVSGPGFQAQLYAGPLGTPEASLLPVFPAVPFRTTPAGFWSPEVLTVPFIAAGDRAVLQARVFETGAGSYETAVATGRISGASNPIMVQLLGNVPGGLPPPQMYGLQSFCLVPEPSTWALASLGAALLCSTRLRRSKS